MELDQQERFVKRCVKLVLQQVQLCDPPNHPLRVQTYNQLKRPQRLHLQRQRGPRIHRKMFVVHNSLMFARTILGVKKVRKTVQLVTASFYLIYRWRVPLDLECAVPTKSVVFLLLASQVSMVVQPDNACIIRKRYVVEVSWCDFWIVDKRKGITLLEVREWRMIRNVIN